MAVFEFRSRGLGLDTTPGCFVCGGGSELRPNIAAFVKSRQSGEAIVRLFGRGARLDYRDFEPNWLRSINWPRHAWTSSPRPTIPSAPS